MPYKNGKGPSGKGPLTGRGFGPCEGDRTNLNFAGFGFGRNQKMNQRRFGSGRRNGRGRKGRGFGYRCFNGRLNPRDWFKPKN